MIPAGRRPGNEGWEIEGNMSLNDQRLTTSFIIHYPHETRLRKIVNDPVPQWMELESLVEDAVRCR